MLDPEYYTIARVTPLEIEARAVLFMLGERHNGLFPARHDDDYVLTPVRFVDATCQFLLFPLAQAMAQEQRLRPLPRSKRSSPTSGIAC